MSRHVWAVVSMVLPQRLKHIVYRRVLGWSVDPSARVGLCYIDVDLLVLERDVSLSHFNVIKGCESVRLGPGALVGAFNWISGRPHRNGAFPHSPQRRPSFTMGSGSAITMRHIIDCADSVRIGDLATLAGHRSQILTHGVDIDGGKQRTAPVEIGDRTLVSTGVTLLAGAVVPPRSHVAAGAVVVGRLGEEMKLYGGVPAKPLKDLDPQAAYFTRTDGVIP